MSDVKLYLGDCLSILPTLTGPVDAIITDLPYGTTACSWDVVIPFAPMWEQVKRLLKPSGAFVTTASQPFTSMLVMSNLEWFKYTLVWDKGVSGSFANAKYQPLKTHEDVCVFSNNGTVYIPQMRRRDKPAKIGGIKNGKSAQGGQPIQYNPALLSTHKTYAKAFPKTVFYVSPRADKQRGLHPTQKPLALYEYLILTYTNPGDTVLDFCMGSGTTGEAAIRTGRNFIGIEIRPDYYGIAEQRIGEAQLQMVMPLDFQPVDASLNL